MNPIVAIVYSAVLALLPLYLSTLEIDTYSGFLFDEIFAVFGVIVAIVVGITNSIMIADSSHKDETIKHLRSELRKSEDRELELLEANVGTKRDELKY